MSKLNLVFFDCDKEYVEAISNLFNRKYYKYFKISSISNYDQFNELVAAAQKIDILVVNESYINKIRNMKFVKTILYLTEDRKSQNIDEGIIYKYQSGQSIFNSIKRIYKQTNKNFDFDDEYDEAYLINVFSPVGGIGKTSVALSLVDKMISYGKKVLYMNLEETSSMGVFFEIDNNKKNISDLLYNIDSSEENIKNIVISMINKSDKGIWYINPHNSILDLEEVSNTDFIKAINYLKRYCECDYIVIDLGSVLNSIYGTLINISDKTLVLMQQNNIAIEKVSLFLKQVDNKDKIRLIFNKYSKNKKIQLSDEILKVKNSILHYIEFDDLLNCEDLSLEVLSVNSKFSSAVGKLVSKIMAEENVTNG